MDPNVSEKLVSRVAEVLHKCGQNFADGTRFKPAQGRRAPLVILALGHVQPGGRLDDMVGWGAGAESATTSSQIISSLAAWGDTLNERSYDSVRRDIIDPLFEAGLVLKNPDKPSRSHNDQTTGYCLSGPLAVLLRSAARDGWECLCDEAIVKIKSQSEEVARAHEAARVPVVFRGKTVRLSPGGHNLLIGSVLDDFFPRFAPGAKVAYICDAENPQLHLDHDLIRELGIEEPGHKELPDILAFDETDEKLWVVEVVWSRGHVSEKRMARLDKRLNGCRFPTKYLNVFPSFQTFHSCTRDLATATESWIAEAPDRIWGLLPAKVRLPAKTVAFDAAFHARPQQPSLFDR